jgi:O-succinylhomoserine sulfhydrylase
MRSAGMSLSPFNAWVVPRAGDAVGPLKAQSERALQMARWLEAHPAVERVYYPGLPSHPQHDLAMAQQSGLGGAVLSFDVKGEREQAWAVVDATRICSITANLGDTKTTHHPPASTSHGRLSEAQRQAAGITPGHAAPGGGPGRRGRPEGRPATRPGALA